ncbi:YcaO-like family protein [Desulfofustis limnaeus]|nr:YcaO-like family protein [Desulfofustis limnaeus]MDX9894792.1 YcaO-like family protein [Desulfofustis sp.]
MNSNKSVMNRKTIVFNDCYKSFTRDQDKALSPEQTIERFFERLERLEVNILSEVRRIDNGRLDIPVYFSVCTDEARALTGTRKQMGKGASPEQAKASACMELAERFSFFSYLHDENNFIRGDYRHVRSLGFPVLEPQWLLRSVGDTRLSTSHLEQLLQDIPLRWCWSTNISTGEPLLLPLSWFYAINEFNGCSAGNTLEEAALQGICEVVERHVCSLINQYRMVTPQIDLESLSDPVARQLIDTFRRTGIDLYLNDFSLDTGISTVGALAVDRSTFPAASEIVYTAGTMTHPEKALIRAVTEIAQLAGDFNTGSNYVASGLPKPLSMDEVAYMTRSDRRTTVDRMSDLSDANMRVEIERCLEALRRSGMEVFMIDVSHPRLDIPALYTIIPGAHFRERSIRRDAGLFAAKLLHDLCDDREQLHTGLERMATLLPDAYYLSFYRGIAQLTDGRYAVAVEQFQRALALQPEKEDRTSILAYQGQALKEEHRYDEAIEVLRLGLEEDEERPDIHNLLGFCHFKKEQYERAITHFERAVALNPASAMDYANLGVNHRRLGNRDEAVHYFTLAVTMDPSIDFARSQLEELLEES